MSAEDEKERTNEGRTKKKKRRKVSCKFATINNCLPPPLLLQPPPSYYVRTNTHGWDAVCEELKGRAGSGKASNKS